MRRKTPIHGNCRRKLKRDCRSKRDPECDGRPGRHDRTGRHRRRRHGIRRFSPGQPRQSSPTQRPMPLRRTRRQKPRRTTRTTAAEKPTPAPSWPRQQRPTSRHSPLQPPLSPIRSSIRRRRQPLRPRHGDRQLGYAGAPALPIVDANTVASSQNASHTLRTPGAGNAAVTADNFRRRKVRCRLQTPRPPPRGKTPKRRPRRETSRHCRGAGRQAVTVSANRQSRAQQASKHRDSDAPIAKSTMPVPTSDSETSNGSAAPQGRRAPRMTPS